MTKEDLAELTRATEDLRLKQETPDSPEALKVVPCLALSDIPKKSTNIPIAVSVEACCTHLFTCSITGSDLPSKAIMSFLNLHLSSSFAQNEIIAFVDSS